MSYHRSRSNNTTCKRASACVREIAAVLLFALFPAKGQDATPPVSVSGPFVGVNWQFNGFGQFRVTNPAQRRADLALSQFSVTASPIADKSTTVFVQAGSSTIGEAGVFLLEAWGARELSSGWRVQAGRFLIPFSRQFLTAPSNLLFPDISAVDAALNAPYAWGSLVSMTRKRFQWTAGAITGVTPVDQLPSTAPVGRPGAVARVDVHLLGPFAYIETDPSEPEAPQLTLGAAALYTRAAFESPVQNLMAGDRTANFTSDIAFRQRGFTFQAAGYRRVVRASHIGRYDDWAGYAQGGYYVLPHRIEAAARIGNIDFGRVNSPDSPLAMREKSVGINWYLRGHFIKLQTDYTWLTIRARGVAPATDGQFRLQLQFAI